MICAIIASLSETLFCSFRTKRLWYGFWRNKKKLSKNNSRKWSNGILRKLNIAIKIIYRNWKEIMYVFMNIAYFVALYWIVIPVMIYDLKRLMQFVMFSEMISLPVFRYAISFNMRSNPIMCSIIACNTIYNTCYNVRKWANEYFYSRKKRRKQTCHHETRHDPSIYLASLFSSLTSLFLKNSWPILVQIFARIIWLERL